jgi:hypothetical protein
LGASGLQGQPNKSTASNGRQSESMDRPHL